MDRQLKDDEGRTAETGLEGLGVAELLGRAREALKREHRAVTRLYRPTTPDSYDDYERALGEHGALIRIACALGERLLGPRATAGLAIGRLFGRLIHRAKPEPVAVIDGIEVFN